MSSFRAPGADEMMAAQALLALKYYGTESVVEPNNKGRTTSDSSASSSGSLGSFAGLRTTSSGDEASELLTGSTTVVRLPGGGCIIRRNASKATATPVLPTVQLSSTVVIAPGQDAMDWQRVLDELAQKKGRSRLVANSTDWGKTMSGSTVGVSEEVERDIDASDDDDISADDRPVSKNVVALGNGSARVPSQLLKKISWSCYKTATRKLLAAVFPRRVLATHSLTGKRSPAFPGKPAKKRLDPAKVSDIVTTVVERCHVSESLVRTTVTTKLADECKMFRTRKRNKKKSKDDTRPRPS